MISFLKKFRLRLYIQKKTDNYLLFAALEFILILAGVLIALQVDNWNEKRIQDQNLQLEAVREEIVRILKMISGH